jgi:hypothetical protein
MLPALLSLGTLCSQEGTVRIEIIHSRIAASVLLPLLASLPLVSCSSRDKARYDTASGAATPASSTTPSFSSAPPATAQLTDSSTSAGSSIAPGADTAGSPRTGGSADTVAAPSQVSSSVAVHKHQSRNDRRHAQATTSVGARSLKRQAVRCVPLASDAPARADFSSSPITLNPCGVGSMNLPTMAPANLANPR